MKTAAASAPLVLIADDHLIIREGLRLILETVEDMELAGEALETHGGYDWRSLAAIVPARLTARPGVYAVTVTVTDDDGGSGSANAGGFIVVYDADGAGLLERLAQLHEPDLRELLQFVAVLVERHVERLREHGVAVERTAGVDLAGEEALLVARRLEERHCRACIPDSGRNDDHPAASYL